MTSNHVDKVMAKRGRRLFLFIFAQFLSQSLSLVLEVYSIFAEESLNQNEAQCVIHAVTVSLLERNKTINFCEHNIKDQYIIEIA